MKLHWVITALFSLGFGSTAAAPNGCRCLPDDDCWPSFSEWESLNKTVSGRLIETVPIGSPCHDPNYDAEACADLQQRWLDPKLHLPSSSSVMSMFFANQSCDPFTPRDSPCELGNYVAYALKVSEPEDVSSAVQFAEEKNIRIVIRNTGHDFFGRSTGAGALSVWTHHLKSTEVISDYKSEDYNGPAFRAGAGVTGAEAIEAAHLHGLAVVTGECPSVGIAGGFTQGGGHSLLSSDFGMAADQVLEYEVVTADGKIRKASPQENSDLYWALSGGGGGTYAIVTSIVVRAYPIGDVGGLKVSFLTNSTSKATFQEAVRRFHSLAPEIVDYGATVTYILSPVHFSVGPFTLTNSTGEYVRDNVAAPYISALEELGVQFETEISTLSFRDHYDKYLGPLPWGTVATTGGQFGGRLLPRSGFEDGSTIVSDALNAIVEAGAVFVGTVGSFSPPHDASNAVLPAWRETLIQVSIMTPWSTDPDAWTDMLDMQEKMTSEIMPLIKEATPGSGSYMNEADFREKNWKQAFFGSNYERLLEIKNKWDPNSLFYILKGVGSDAWDVHESGRMCRAGSDS